MARPVPHRGGSFCFTLVLLQELIADDVYRDDRCAGAVQKLFERQLGSGWQLPLDSRCYSREFHFGPCCLGIELVIHSTVSFTHFASIVRTIVNLPWLGNAWPMRTPYARPILSAAAGAAAMAVAVLAYDPAWYVRWAVAIGVTYAVWGVSYLAARA